METTDIHEITSALDALDVNHVEVYFAIHTGKIDEMEVVSRSGYLVQKESVPDVVDLIKSRARTDIDASGLIDTGADDFDRGTWLLHEQDDLWPDQPHIYRYRVLPDECDAP